eukprot:5945758-Lingulodinium_polyedra.AAC.1
MLFASRDPSAPTAPTPSPPRPRASARTPWPRLAGLSGPKPRSSETPRSLGRPQPSALSPSRTNSR